MSEAILMNLKREPAVLRPPGGSSSSHAIDAIEDQTPEPKAGTKQIAKRNRRKERAGGAAEYKASTTGPKKFASYLRYAH